VTLSPHIYYKEAPTDLAGAFLLQSMTFASTVLSKVDSRLKAGLQDRPTNLRITGIVK